MSFQKVFNSVTRLAGLMVLTMPIIASACSNPPLATGMVSQTVIISQSNPSVAGDSVTFLAVVSPRNGTGQPGGTVTFKDGSTALGTVTIDQNGLASFTSTALSAGNHEVTSFYSGDSEFAPSASPPITQTVRQILILTTTTNTSTPTTATGGSTSPPSSSIKTTVAPTTSPAPSSTTPVTSTAPWDTGAFVD